MKDTQDEIVLKHLKNKSITSMDAFVMYRITRLAAKIHSLRKQGHSIRTKMEKNKRSNYARYFLNS